MDLRFFKTLITVFKEEENVSQHNFYKLHSI